MPYYIDMGLGSNNFVWLELSLSWKRKTWIGACLHQYLFSAVLAVKGNPCFFLLMHLTTQSNSSNSEILEDCQAILPSLWNIYSSITWLSPPTTADRDWPGSIARLCHVVRPRHRPSTCLPSKFFFLRSKLSFQQWNLPKVSCHPDEIFSQLTFCLLCGYDGRLVLYRSVWLCVTLWDLGTGLASVRH